jgi:hypothetical protein
MKAMKTLIFGLATALLAASPAFADVHLTMQDGRVSIVAKDATVRQILTEWARVGQTKIVNVERIPGGPVTLELNNVTETQALEVLLRTLSGYITAPRAVAAKNLSSFDRIIVMPTLAAARAPVAASSSAPPPVFQQAVPQFQQPVEDDQDDAPAPAPNVAMPLPNGAVPPQNRGPVFNTFPRAVEIAPQGVLPGGIVPVNGGVPQQGAPVTFPNSPTAPFGGVAVPGMIAPAPPQQPGQIQPGAPGQPVRRPGGQ